MARQLLRLGQAVERRPVEAFVIHPPGPATRHLTALAPGVSAVTLPDLLARLRRRAAVGVPDLLARLR
jgi:hypothetical protein